MQTVTGISRPTCMRGDQQYLESTTVTLMFPPPIFSDANVGKTLFVFWPLGQYVPNLNLFQFV